MNNGQAGMTLRERQKTQTKAHLLSVATSLMTDRGFSAISIDDIAKAAGSSRATVYSYFATKDSILAEIVQTMWDDANEMYGEFGELTEWTRETVSAWVDSVAKRWQADAARNRAAADVGRLTMLEQYRDNHKRHIESLTRQSNLWRARFSPEDTHSRASMLITLIEHHIVNPYMADEDRDTQTAFMTGVWLDILHARP